MRSTSTSTVRRAALGFSTLGLVLTGLACQQSSRLPDAGGVRFLPMEGLVATDTTISAPHVIHDAGLSTFRVGREAQAARVVRGPQRLTRILDVPAGGALLETAIAPLREEVTLRVHVEGRGEPWNFSAPPGRWSSASVPIPSNGRGRVQIVEELIASASELVLWSNDTLVAGGSGKRPPDVVLIVLDTVRPDYLTPYVDLERSTPTLALLARESTRFDQAISVSSWTMPAHAALFTGEYPPLTLGFTTRLEPESQTLAEIFSARGYRTLGVSGGPYTDDDFGFQQGFSSYLNSGDWKNASAATSWAIDHVQRASSAPAPLFLFLNYFDAHEPNTGMSSAEWQSLHAGKASLNASVVERLQEGYRSDLRVIDRELGHLFEALRRERDWNNTLVVVLSDHGQLLGERGSIGHALTLEEELLRVPLIVKAPGETGASPRVYREQIQLTDVFDLILELSGFAPQGGESLRARIAAGTPLRRLAFAQLHHDPKPELLAFPRWRSATQRAVRTDQTKVLIDAEGRVTTYRLEWGTEVVSSRTALTDRLLAELQQFAELSRAAAPSAALHLREDVLHRLRALGYVR